MPSHFANFCSHRGKQNEVVEQSLKTVNSSIGRNRQEAKLAAAEELQSERSWRDILLILSLTWAFILFVSKSQFSRRNVGIRREGKITQLRIFEKKDVFWGRYADAY